jgi:hypothetical protein
MSAYTNAHPAALGAYPPDGREWVVLLTPDTRRMMSTREVQAEVSAGTLSRETLVWRAGMSEWMAIAGIGELDVPSARPHRVAPSVSWEAPAAGHPQPTAHDHARPHAHAHAQRPASNAELTQELVATGAVAVIVVAITLYVLSLGGAFAPGKAHHAAASGSAQQAAH